MAKKSDFAQKLLDDLRLRKEQMGLSQRSNQSHQLPIDAYAYTKQTYRGSRKTKANEIVSSRTGNLLMLNKSGKSQRSPYTRQVSNQIVPFGKDQSSDMSIALAFAFENGAKLKSADSIMGFLNQMKRRTTEFGMRERPSNLDRQLTSTTHCHTLSPLQINEISKGAMKLNQILRACSTGLNMDTIQFAKELLQGAIDLEESLKMLADLQKSSEYMITPQKKNRIILLEDDSDDDRSIVISEQKQLARPIFSFDKPSKHTQNMQQVGKATYMQRPITVTYSKEGRNSNVETVVPHKRSTSSSYGNDISERKNQTMSVQSNTEKGRIPNVIARLMGLEKLPEEADSGYMQKIEGNHTAKGSTKKTELKNKRTENLLPAKNQRVIEALKMPATRDQKVTFGADKGIEKASIKMDSHNHSSSQKNLVRMSQKDVQVNGRKQDYTNNQEQKGTVMGRTNDPVLNDMREQVHERPQVKSSLQDEKEIIRYTIQSEKKHSNLHIIKNEKKSWNNLGVQKSYILSKNGLQEEKHLREQPRDESMLLEMTPQGGKEMESANQLVNPQKKQLSIKQNTSFKKNPGENVAPMKLENSHYDNRDEVINEASTVTNEKVKETTNRNPGIISSPRDREFVRVKGRHGIKKLMDEKHVHKLASTNIKNTRKQKVDMRGKIDQVLTRRNGITKERKKQITSLQERHRAPDKFNVLKEERVTMSEESDAHVIRSSNESVAEPLDVKSQPQKEAEIASMLYSSGGRELQRLQESVALVSNDLHYEDVQLLEANLQDQALPVATDEGFKAGEVAEHIINGIHEDRMGISNHSQLQDHSISEISIQQPLTDSENCLKWILVMSQLFINTAESLFRLNIPLSVLQNGGPANQDEDIKLILDCGYEVMKRTGIRQELKVHTCSNISISTVYIRSLDDLVRKLNNDMEKLKFYGKNRTLHIDVEDYLPKMLEDDVYDKDPDIDCMWDLGWNDETLAFIEKYDVIRDTEKHILSILLDEITGELFAC
ncbi:hypothetical protein TanjilG_13781 [Lupinus angustifolius]|uniref:DUF3741 domain-containing protein n=1 Tax=Lupinus angustifolius TaxID=3871 RepID=A0A1J7GX65_LUPAN|nr:PREDICTED: uncharacterized protein LOC109330680 [Lupinus angustifolius]OIV94164.1 hypothetical protein TanjilG_13781 [Lupinus angustifolius]